MEACPMGRAKIGFGVHDLLNKSSTGTGHTPVGCVSCLRRVAQLLVLPLEEGIIRLHDVEETPQYKLSKTSNIGQRDFGAERPLLIPGR